MASTVVSSATAPKPNSQSYANSPLQNKPSDDNSNDTSEKKETPGRAKLRSWLHSLMSVVLSDGRTLVGTFVCTDRDANIILSSCTEHLPHSHTDGEEEARMLGLAMIPGRHVVSMSVDERTINQHHQPHHHHHPQQTPQEEGDDTTPGENNPPPLQVTGSAIQSSHALDPPSGYT